MYKSSNLLPNQIIARAITILGNWYIVIPTAIIFSLTLSVSSEHFFSFWMGIILLTIAVQLIKIYSQKERPALPLLKELTYAFPSGHSATSFYLYGWAVAQYIIRHGITPNSFVLFVIIFGLISTIALSRLTLRVHDLQDVSAGLIIGGTFLFFSLTNL